MAEMSGADGITMHLREDRRHIQTHDVYRAREVVTTTLNMEMAATEEMLEIASDVQPDYCCLVPERREELTTEGGVDVAGQFERLQLACIDLAKAGIRVSLFIEPEQDAVDAASEAGADIVELHTGSYANARGGAEVARQLDRLIAAAERATTRGLQVNAGHGLHAANVAAVAAIPQMVELNIGHAIIARALMVGLDAAVAEMKEAMLRAAGGKASTEG